MSNNRDDFSESTKELLAKRAGFRCSNPNCGRPTFGSNVDPNKATNIGVAAHICAAAPLGPRYDSEMTSKERKSPSNGIWLCQSCSKLIDSDPLRYTRETLYAWKKIAEITSALQLERPFSRNTMDDRDHSAVESSNNRWFSKRDKHLPISFGYKSIDDFCKLVEGSVILVSGYVGIGIDAFVQNVARYNLKKDSRVIYFNLKESSSTIINSILAAESHVGINDIRTANLTAEQWTQIALAANSLGQCQIIFNPHDSNISSMPSHFLSAITSGNADIVVLDDLDGLCIENATSLNSFLYQMRNAAIQSGTIVFLLVDLDEIPKRMDKRPMLYDPKGNRISKFCDVIQFLYHADDDYFPSGSDIRILELIFAKSYLPTQSEIFYLAQFPSYSEITEYRQSEETHKDFTHKHPGMIAGLKMIEVRFSNVFIEKRTFHFGKPCRIKAFSFYILGDPL